MIVMVWYSDHKMNWTQDEGIYQKYKVWKKQVNWRLNGPLKSQTEDVNLNYLLLAQYENWNQDSLSVKDYIVNAALIVYQCRF